MTAIANATTNPTNRFAIDTDAVAADLDREGHSVVRGLLDAATAEELVAGFDDDRRYRSTIDMARHGYGVGTYRYFTYPLPPAVDALRTQLYRQLVPVADEWAERLGSPERYAAELHDFLAQCAAAGQLRPTPLILRYHPGHYNCLHQDRYGEVAFPLQVAILLTPRAEFDGGELALVEQRPRAQSRVHVVSLDQGDAVVFPNQVRPGLGSRGAYRVQVRHGVATLRRGRRHALGVIFHDAA
jgi:hypothetical protein